MKRFDPDFPDRQIGATCRKWRVPFVAAKEHMGSSDYKKGDVHWNEQGHQRVSKLLSSLYHDYCSEQKKEVRAEIQGGSLKSLEKARSL
jgi:hypothetical protein